MTDEPKILNLMDALKQSVEARREMDTVDVQGFAPAFTFSQWAAEIDRSADVLVHAYSFGKDETAETVAGNRALAAKLREAAEIEAKLAAANKRIEEFEIEMHRSNRWLDATLARLDSVIADARSR